MRLIGRLALIAFFGLSAAWGAEHNPLLPRPQKVQYGAGRLTIRGLGVRFATPPANEDRFAAAELSRLLLDRTGLRIALWETATSGPAVVLNRTGPVDALPVPDEQPGPDSREAYHLKAGPGGVEIRARSSAGVFYGVQTLAQLVEGEGEAAALPEIEVDDWASLAYRGPMVDMSHGALPTEDDVKRQLDFLARWKTNQYYFYNEASIELDGYPLLNPEGRFTQDQVRRIIAYGRDRHIDVIPCLELYGHLHDLFRIERYADLGAGPHSEEFNPANPKVLALLTDWADQLSRLFPSPFVHIGFDETWQIEKAAQQQGAGATPAKLFVQQLSNVARLFQSHGKRVMAWGDIMVKYPEIVAQLPPGIIAVAWYYEPTPDPEYKKWLAPLVAKNIPHIVATGVTSWNQIAPDYDTTFANIDTFLAAGRRSHALGLMNTVWTDDAQNLIRMSWPGMAYGAAAPWQSEPMDSARFFQDYAGLMYPAAVAPHVGTALEKLRQAETALQSALGKETQLEMWADPFSPSTLKRTNQHREDLRQARLQAEDAAENVYRALAAGGDPTTLNSQLFGCRLVDYAAMKFLNGAEIADKYHSLGPHPSRDEWWRALESDLYYQSHGRLADMMDAISELRRVYQSLWLAEYTPYRLASALGRWDAEYDSWRAMQERFEAFARTYHPGDTLPALESFTKGN